MTTDSAAPKCVLCGNELEHLVLYGLNTTSNYFRCLNKDCLLHMTDLLQSQAEALAAKLGRQDQLRKYTIWQEKPIAARDEGLTLRELFNMSDWSCDEINKLACLNTGESISVDGLITVERTK